MPRPSRAVPAALAAAMFASALGLAGCSSEESFAPACPGLTMLPDAADITRYRAAGQDITDVIVDARITAIPATCQPDPDAPNKVDATLRVAMAAQRGPAATSRRIDLPYFVAVMDGERVLDRQDYTLVAEFADNTDRALITSPPIDLVLPVTHAKSAAAYSIYVGYQLSPDELAVNRRRGPR